MHLPRYKEGRRQQRRQAGRKELQDRTGRGRKGAAEAETPVEREKREEQRGRRLPRVSTER
jgi:hypothetical protein